MKHIKTPARILLILSVFLSFAVSGYAKTPKQMPQKKTENTFEKPDFAFPQTVSENARIELDKALNEGNYNDAVKATIQMYIAASRVSDQNRKEVIALCDSLAPTLPAPWSNMLYGFEASVYSAIYNAKSWTYNRRNVPLEDVPDDYEDWSSDIFAMKVTELVEKSLANKTTAFSTPVADMKGILSLGSTEAYPTTLDFLALNATLCLNDFAGASGTPLFRSSGKKSVSQQASLLESEVIDDMISLHASRSLPQAMWVEMKSSQESYPYKYLMAKADEFAGTVGEFVLLCKAYDYINAAADDDAMARRVKFYHRAQKALASDVDSPLRNNLDYHVGSISAPAVSAEVSKRYLSDEKISGTVALTNLESAEIRLYKVDFNDDSPRADELIGKTPTASAMVKVSGEIPFEATASFEIPALSYGRYAVVIMPGDDEIKGVYERIPVETFIVSDLMVISSGDSEKDDRRIYVSDAHLQKPVAGAKVQLYKNDYGKKKAGTLVTNAEGYAVCPKGYYEMEISYKSDKLNTGVGFYGWGKNDCDQVRTQVFTDRSIYRPGDTVNFAVVAFEQKDFELLLLPGEEVKITLDTKNGDDIGENSVTLVCDEFGRVAGSLTIPSSCVNGTYYLESEVNEEYCGSTTFQVADYVAPGFFVNLEGGEGKATLGNVVTVKGRAMTYSGMPVADAKVDFNVVFRQPWWWYMDSDSNAQYGATTQTAADGTFELQLPTAELRDTPYAIGCFEVTASVTSASGETQMAIPYMFSLGNKNNISASVAKKMNADGNELTFNAEVKDMLDRSVQAEVDYKITAVKSGKEIASGNMEGTKLHLATKLFPSGEYEITFSSADATPKASKFVVWRASDKTPPVDTPLWVPLADYTAAKGEKKVHITLGASYPGEYILCQIAGVDGVKEQKWLVIPAKDSNIAVDVDAPKGADKVWINLIGTYNGETESETITVNSYESAQKLMCNTISFRDKIEPGTPEKWTFQFVDTDNTTGVTPVMAVMTDKALNALAPFHWSFNPSVAGISTDAELRALYLNYKQVCTQSLVNPHSFKKMGEYKFPQWYLYGMSLNGSTRKRSANTTVYAAGSAQRMKNTAATADAPMPCVEYALFDDVAMVEEMADDAGMVEGKIEEAADPMRDVECPLAFFKPMLAANADGIVEIDFDVPDFNTTWQFQLLGYNEKLQTSVTLLETVASKPVMVKLNAPRFLRTSDDAAISALLMNNTDEQQSIGGSIEIFDPVSGNIIHKSELSNIKVAAKGTQPITITFTVPTDMQMIGVRAYATGGNHKDGEQTIVGILPSSSPVIESTNFYLSGKSPVFSATLPEFGKDATVTFQMCANPIWTCITALPEIADPSSASILGKVRALFANSITTHIADTYPQVRPAIKDWFSANGNDVLVSNLLKNQDLKILTLGETIWTHDATSETLRMAQLDKMLDKERSDEIIKSLLDDISKSQQSDGGWSWCEGMKSSEYITGRVLLNLAAMKDAGALPQDRDMSKMISSAMGFCDDWILDDYKRTKEKNYNYASLLDYLYVRSYFPEEASGSAEFNKLKTKALKVIASNWRKFDIYELATAAMLLKREGYKTEPRNILESLRQLSMKDPAKGVWYDNIRSGYNSFPRLIITAQVLEAFAEVAPNDKEMIDGLRQWLVLQRQTQDWGGESYTVEVVNAILRSGSQWLEESQTPQVTLNGRSLPLPASDKYVGEFRIDLKPQEASGAEIKVVSDSDGPAWGGVIARFIRPMNEVKASEVPQLSISKQVCLVSDSADGTLLTPAASFKVGDRVRVQLTIHCDRDMEYVVVNDERSACMQPADQLSHYTSCDGVWYYSEVKNAVNNLFFSYLPKGNHIVFYDCFVDREGEYALGIATAQSLYAPLIVAHSSGSEISIK